MMDDSKIKEEIQKAINEARAKRIKALDLSSPQRLKEQITGANNDELLAMVEALRQVHDVLHIANDMIQTEMKARVNRPVAMPASSMTEEDLRNMKVEGTH